VSYHRDLAEEIAALDKLIEAQIDKLAAEASPEQEAILNDLRQVLALKKALLHKLTNNINTLHNNPADQSGDQTASDQG
jgi:hypothetical protein